MGIVDRILPIGQMADAYELTVAPHNYYSHLADLHSIHLCAVLPNVKIMEIDIDDVAWKKDLVTCPPTIENGHILLPTGPGWGTDINEDVLRYLTVRVDELELELSPILARRDRDRERRDDFPAKEGAF